MSSAPPPPPFGPHGSLPPQAPRPEADRAWWRRKALLPLWTWIGIVVVLVAVLGVVASVAGDDTDQSATDELDTRSDVGADSTDAEDATAQTASEPKSPGTPGAATRPSTAPPLPPTSSAPVTTSGPLLTAPPATTSASTPATDAAPSSDEIAGAPSGATGTRASPVPVGEIADLGSGWRLQVLDLIADGTAAVAAENEFNEPPPPGSIFTLVKVAVGYFGLDEPASAFETTISAVGGGNTELAQECGVLPQELDSFNDLFAGAVVVGNLCFVTTPTDASVLEIYAQAGFDGEQVFLNASAPPAAAVPMVGLAGPQAGASATESRLAPLPIATPADVGEGWQVTVTAPAADITDIVLAENEFNVPPPEGMRFVAVPITYAYNGADSAAPFEVTLGAVTDSNRQLGTDCGVIPGEIDQFADVFAGGVVSGQLCFITPADQLSSLVLYAAAGFDTDYEVLGTN